MIIIKNLIKYGKFCGFFIILETFIAFFISLLNIIGINEYLGLIILYLSNLIIFFIYGFINGKHTDKKGFLEGLYTGLILVAILFLISLIFFIKDIKLMTFIYYLMLVTISMIGATIGKNKKEEANCDKN